MWRLLFLGVVPAASYGLTLDLDGVAHTHSDKSLYAVNQDGSTKWVFNSDDKLGPHAEGLNKAVYVSTNSTLFSLHGEDGSIMWKHDMRAGRVSGLSVPSGLSVAKDGTAYFTSHFYPPEAAFTPTQCLNTTVHAITPTGAEKWTFTCAGCVGLSDVGPDGTLFLGMISSSMQPKDADEWFALHPDTGATKWKLARTSDTWSELSVRGPHVFRVTSHGNAFQYSEVSSLSYEDGSIRWSHPFHACQTPPSGRTPSPVPLYASPHVTMGHDGELYVSGFSLNQEKCSYGVFDFNGKNLRNLPCTYESHSEILPCQSAAYSRDEDVFVSYSDGNVLAFSGADGSISWRAIISSSFSESRFSFGQEGTVFVGQFDATTWSRDLSQTSAIRTGKVLWKEQTHGLSEPLMLEDGTTYVDSWHCQEFDCELELIAVGADGVEKWRSRPTNESVEEKAEAIAIAV